MSYVLPIIVALLVFFPLSTVFGQTMIVDLNCDVCQEIPDRQTLKLFKKELPIVIWADPPIYDHASIINLYGHSNRGENWPVTITVTNPIGSVVNIQQVVPDENGNFELDFNTSGKLWKKDGSYIVSAQIGSNGGLKIFRIQLLVLPDVGAESLINYEIVGGKVINVEPDLESTSLIIDLEDTNTDGLIRLYLPRSIIDAKLPSQEIEGMAGVQLPQIHKVQYDDEFVVMLDRAPIVKVSENLPIVEFEKDLPIGMYDEKTILDTRILTIPFQSGAQQIEIQGTFVIPEFDSISIMILAIALAPILALLRTKKFVYLRK